MSRGADRLVHRRRGDKQIPLGVALSGICWSLTRQDEICCQPRRPLLTCMSRVFPDPGITVLINQVLKPQFWNSPIKYSPDNVPPPTISKVSPLGVLAGIDTGFLVRQNGPANAGKPNTLMFDNFTW